jgi:tRNA pseudouridine55 synthase
MTAEPGLVVVDKPGGMTSHDVVSRVRRLAETRKVGHSGTLDPMATGVLVLAVNRATRLLGHLILTDKRYDATIRLGATTTTDDAEGEIVESRSTADVTAEAVRTVLAAFVGETDQVPSSVSAIKVDGKRADLPVRRVTVHSLEVTGLDLPEVRISVHCSSGTYIRAIARDLGAALGVGGHLTALRRTAVGPFTLDQARTLDQLAECFALTPVAEAARATFPARELDGEQAAHVRVGRALDVALEETTALFAPDGEFLALYEPRDGGARAVAVFV